MLYPREKFTAKSGKTYILKSPEKSDAKQMIDYLKATASETEFGISYPEELDFSIKDEEDFINKFSSGKSSIMISVFDGNILVGNASLSPVLDKKKTSHRAEFGIAMLKKVWGQGLGYKVLSELINFAKIADYEQIELEVSSCNTPAVSLYKKLGFVIYGIRPRSLKLKNGGYYDDLLMVLKLNNIQVK